MSISPSTDLRFDSDEADLCDDASSIATVRSASIVVNESGDDFSLIDAESSRSESVTDDPSSWEGDADSPNPNQRAQLYYPATPPQTATQSAVMDGEPLAQFNDAGLPDQLPELAHDGLETCQGCEEERDGCHCSNEFLPPMRSEAFEPITPPSFEPLAPIDVSPDFIVDESIHRSTSHASSVWEQDAHSDVVSSKTPSVVDRGMGIASPRLFDVDDIELQNDMLLTLRYLDSAAEQA